MTLCGSSMERFLRLGCKLSGKPFLLIIFLDNVIESEKQKKTKKNYTACNLA